MERRATAGSGLELSGAQASPLIMKFRVWKRPSHRALNSEVPWPKDPKSMNFTFLIEAAKYNKNPSHFKMGAGDAVLGQVGRRAELSLRD